MKKTYLFLLAAVVFILAACTPSENNTPKELTGISLNKKSIEVEVDDTYQLKVLYEPEEAEDTAPEVTWESSKERIAKVSQTGKVTGVKTGTATITATCGKFTAECEVEVVEATDKPDTPDTPDTPGDVTLSVSPKSIDCPAEGGTFTISVTADGLVWTASSSESWATVSSETNVGSADITVTVEPSDVATTTTADITFSGNGQNKVVKITREGRNLCFSVSDKQKVIFSKGNLQFQAITQTWRFAEHQYDYIGDANKNISSTYSGWIDLFGWGTGASLSATYSSASFDLYTKFNDWGANKISNGGNTANQWRTLTHDEWVYLYSGRTNAAGLRGLATVNNVHGCIFLPDDWSLPAGLSFTADAKNWANTYSTSDWAKMEQNGAVFLPAGGMRTDKIVNNVDAFGHYWSSMLKSSTDVPYILNFNTSGIYPDDTSFQYNGNSVRVVKDL